MTVESTIDILKIIVPLLITALIFIVRWGQRIEASIAKQKSDDELTLSKHEGRIVTVEDLTKYLVEAGKNIKDQLIQHELIVNEIRVDLRYMKDQQTEIIKLLREKK